MIIHNRDVEHQIFVTNQNIDVFELLSFFTNEHYLITTDHRFNVDIK